MTKPTPRHHELVQRERPRDSATAVAAAGGEATAGDGGEGGPPPLEPAMARRYWVAIVLWSIGFALMIVYEIIAVLWRT
ncbi:MAG: hypothetical protein L0Z62_08345 [Gemmataceae bacterium]|nr:hypothetical protein [Gemmataceae bacterium]